MSISLSYEQQDISPDFAKSIAAATYLKIWSEAPVDDIEPNSPAKSASLLRLSRKLPFYSSFAAIDNVIICVGGRRRKNFSEFSLLINPATKEVREMKTFGPSPLLIHHSLIAKK